MYVITLLGGKVGWDRNVINNNQYDQRVKEKKRKDWLHCVWVSIMKRSILESDPSIKSVKQNGIGTTDQLSL